MQSSVIPRVFAYAFLGMRKSVIEQRIALALALLAIPVNYARHKLSVQALRDNAWDTLLPWILLLCLYFAWHVLKAMVGVYRDEQQTFASPIVITDGHREPTIPPLKFRLSLYGGACLLLTIPALFSYLVWSRATEPPRIPPGTNNGISVLFDGCRFAGLPVSIPAHSILHLVPLSPKRIQSVPWGLYDIPNDTDEQQQWPPKKKIELAKKQDDFGIFLERCEVSNHGQVNLVDVAIPIKFWFGGKGGDENDKKYMVVLSPIDAGIHFVFYIGNVCRTLVAGVIQDTARVIPAGESAWRDVPLSRPYRNPAEEIMMFPPTSVHWIDGEPCQ
jgi:hypothetical protein